jgi:methionine-rich copper-binding protein CopC
VFARLRLVVGGAILVAGLLAWPISALGHADLVSSEPADGSVVQGPFAGPVVLTFDEALAEGSTATLTGPVTGSPLTTGPDASDPTRMAFVLEAGAPPGAYSIEWTSVGEDGHIERGTLSFTVATGGTTASPAPTAEPSTPPGDNVTPSDIGPEVIVAILVGLALVGLIGWRILRRGSDAA